ncbi:MAG: DUF4859 domain-containing protein [Paludibacteraceae bacterium]|nr:DUF4859 domain-containing protein [Paludibacteraceae bacterium]
MKNGSRLPAGLSLSSDGVVSGVPSDGFDGNVTIVMKDANNTKVEKEFYLKIKQIVTVAEYSFNVEVDVNDGYNATIVDVNMANLAGLLGISASDLLSEIGKNVSLYAVDSNGNLEKSFTANKGYWYNLSGNVEQWTENSTSAAVFAEIDPDGNGMRIGQYPGNTKVGDTCTIRQVLIYGEAQIMLIYKVHVTDQSSVESLPALLPVDGVIRVYNEKGQFIGEIDSFTELENIGSTHGVYMLEQCGVWYKIVK